LPQLTKRNSPHHSHQQPLKKKNLDPGTEEYVLKEQCHEFFEFRLLPLLSFPASLINPSAVFRDLSKAYEDIRNSRLINGVNVTWWQMGKMCSLSYFSYRTVTVNSNGTGRSPENSENWLKMQKSLGTRH
jgi:hypothetical protein